MTSIDFYYALLELCVNEDLGTVFLDERQNLLVLKHGNSSWLQTKCFVTPHMWSEGWDTSLYTVVFISKDSYGNVRNLSTGV
jgi:hypothetical protein